MDKLSMEEARNQSLCRWGATWAPVVPHGAVDVCCLDGLPRGGGICTLETTAALSGGNQFLLSSSTSLHAIKSSVMEMDVDPAVTWLMVV